jgi:hypothetical protein
VSTQSFIEVPGSATPGFKIWPLSEAVRGDIAPRPAYVNVPHQFGYRFRVCRRIFAFAELPIRPVRHLLDPLVPMVEAPSPDFQQMCGTQCGAIGGSRHSSERDRVLSS